MDEDEDEGEGENADDDVRRVVGGWWRRRRRMKMATPWMNTEMESLSGSALLSVCPSVCLASEAGHRV